MSLITTLRTSQARRLISMLSVVAVVGATLVAAVRADGYHMPDFKLNDAGVWVTRSGDVGRVNTEVRIIDYKVAPEGSGFDVLQSGPTVLIHQQSSGTSSGSLQAIDPSKGTISAKKTPTPAGADVKIGGPTVAAFDAKTGHLWVSNGADLERAPFGEPTTTIKGGSDFAVGLDGTVHVLAAAPGLVYRFRADGSKDKKSTGPVSGASTVTAEGATSLVLDPEAPRVIEVGRGDLDITGLGDKPVLQLPGPANEGVLVATDKQLALVRFGRAKPEVFTESGTGSPTEPVWVAGCAYGAWQTLASQAVACPGRAAVPAPIAGLGSSKLRFRVNHKRVVLNELGSGLLMVFDQADAERVTDWDQALVAKKEEDSGETDPGADNAEVKQANADFAVTPDNHPPEANPDHAATRPGRPVIVRVTGNDRDEDGDVLVVDHVGELAADVGSVSIVDGGRDVQFTPAADRLDPVVFPYTVNDGRSSVKATADVTVEIHPPEQNTPPTAKPDNRRVAAGRSVEQNVLTNDEDPDGDALTLTDVAVPTGEGAVQFRPDGTVVYSAPGTAEGAVVLTYKVDDGLGGVSVGKFNVEVLSGNQPPTAFNDHVRAIVGREAVLNVLANDFDPNGDELSVVRVDNRPELVVQWSPDGEFRIRGDQPDSFNVSYVITDGTETHEAVIRVDVVARGTGEAPVAVRDDIVLRPSVPALALVLANDYDPDGDVLVIESIQPPEKSPLVIEIVDRRLLRVTTSTPLEAPIGFTYVMSDGTGTSVGTVVARPAPSTGVNQPPLAVRDEISVRASNITAIRVLANDSDPDGDEITLVGVTAVSPENGGLLFAQGNELRYQAPDGERGAVTAHYTVEDTAGNKSDGEVVIHVTPKDSTRNLPPAPPILEARTVSGGRVAIRVPLVGMDPEGDAVTLVGLGQILPTLGAVVETTSDGFVYQAGANAIGTDHFDYKVVDDLGAEAAGAVNVGIIRPPSENGEPVAVSDRAQVVPGGRVRVNVLTNDSDPDGDPLALVPDALAQPTKGATELDGDVVVYDATGAVANQEVSFEYVITDGRGATARGLVTVEVVDTVPPVKPIARDDLLKAHFAGDVFSVDVLANDEDPDGDKARLTIEVVGQPAASVQDAAVSVTMPDQALSFAYTITDTQGEKASAFVQVPLAKKDADPADLPPVPVADEAETELNQAVTVDVLQNDVDPEGKQLLLGGIAGQRNGTAETDGNKVKFTPATDFSGDGGFTYEVSDGKNVARGSASIRVKKAVNEPPKFTTLPVEVAAGGDKTVDLASGVSDPDVADKHTFSDLTGQTEKITASLEGSVLTVHALPDAKNQAADIGFKVSDGKEDGDVQGIVRVRVLASDKPLPRAVNDTVETNQEKVITVDVLANDVGEEVKLLSVKPGTGGGSAVASGDQAVFTPATGFFGNASFTYVIGDKFADPDRQATGTVTVTVIGRPSAPPAPTGTVASKKVTLSWAVPSANGAPIEEYEVQTDSGLTRKCPSNTCEIGGLTNDTAYRFKVRAHNKAGDGEFSGLSAPLTPDEIPGVPNAPTLAFGDTKITVNWVAPPNEGSALTEYTLQISPPPTSGPGTKSVAGTASSDVWSGLTNGTSYKVRIRAVNKAGASEYGGYSNTEIPAGPPLQPSPPTVTNDDGKIPVQWTEPGLNGDAIQTYELQVRHNGAVESPLTTINNPSSRSYVVDPARNGDPYAVAVRATNKAGAGPWSAESSAKPRGKPLAIGGISATEDDTTSTLSFSAPGDNGDPISGYKVSTNNGADIDLASDKVVRSLSNGTNYSFQVKACNVAGCGNYGPASNTVNPYGLPGIPSVSGSVNDRTITWNWNTPDGNGRPVTGFEIHRDGGSVSFSGTAYSEQFCCYNQDHGLDVWAVNARGRSNDRGHSTQHIGSDPTPVCSPFTVYSQNAWDPLGTSKRASPDHTSTKVGSYSGNSQIRVNGWTYGSTPYPANPAPFNNNVWYRVADGSGWVSFPGVRGGPTTYDPTQNDNPGPPAPTPSECKV